MARKWLFTGIAVIVIVAAGLYGGLVLYPAARFRAMLGEAKALLPVGVSLDYKSADYSFVQDRATLSGVVLISRGAFPFRMTIERMGLERPSLSLGNEWQRAKANPKSLTPETGLLVAQAIRMRGITFTALNMTEKVGSERVEGLRFYPWPFLQPGVPSLAQVEAILAAKTPPRTLREAAPLFRFVAALGLGFGYSHLTSENIQTTSRLPATAEFPARDVSTSIAGSQSTGVDRGDFGAGQAETVRMALGQPVGSLRIDKIAVTDADARRPLERLLDGSALTRAAVDGLAIGRLEASGMTLERPGEAPVPLGTFALTRLAFADGVPVSAELAWDGIRLTSAEMPNPEVRLAFDRLGLDHATINFAAAYNWELRAGRFALQEVRLAIPELASLGLSANLTGVTPDRDALERASLAHAILRYRDASLTQRAFAAAASFMHTDAPALRRQAIAMIQARSMEFRDSPALAQAAQAIVSFLEKPETLTVELSPPTPVPLASLRGAEAMAPPDLARVLGLAVTAGP